MSKKLSSRILLVFTIIVSLWVSMILIISGIGNCIFISKEFKQFGSSFSVFPKFLYQLINPSGYNLDGMLYLLRLIQVVTFLSSAIEIFTGLLLLTSSVAIFRSKKWGLKATALAAICCYFVYSINMLLIGLRFNIWEIILIYFPIIYLSFVQFLKPLRERVGLDASTIREKIGAIALPVLIFVFSGIIYVNAVNTVIAKETLITKLESGNKIESLLKNTKYPDCEWIEQWSFCILKGLIKKPLPQEKDGDYNTDNALWKGNNNQFILLSMPAVTEKISLPPSKNRNYEVEKEILDANFWDGFPALAYKDYLTHRKNGVYNLIRPNIKAIVYVVHPKGQHNWYVNANVYPLNRRSINYQSSNKSLETALAPLIMTLNEYEKRIKN